MIVRLKMNTGMVDIKKMYSLDCPNKAGGISDIVIMPEGTLWGGWTHFYTGILRFSFGAITSIETRSDDSESDEPWKERWRYHPPFTYRQYYLAANVLKYLMGRKEDEERG